MQFKVKPLDEIDFYKAGHYAQYPENTVEIFSNFTPRSTRTGFDKVVVMGIQMLIHDIHQNWKTGFFDLSEEEIIEDLEEYRDFMDSTIYPEAVNVDHILEVWKLGYLPLEIKAIDEGVLTNVGVPVMTIRNTHPSAYWLVNYLETKISNALWKPITSATTAFQYLKTFHHYANITGANLEFIKFQGHDFSYRGMSGNEDAVSSGIGHLSCFAGTDTVPAIKASEYYGYGSWQNQLIGCSVVATEHSVMCAGGKNEEIETFERLLDTFPTNIISIVSDTWDYWKVITEFLPQLKDKIMNRDGRVVIRPDSGDPIDIICGTSCAFDDLSEHCLITNDGWDKNFINNWIVQILEAERNDKYYMNKEEVRHFMYFGKLYSATIRNFVWEYLGENYFIDYSNPFDIDIQEVELTIEQRGTFELLWDTFGGTINDKGYKVLDPHIGLIYGDSITLERQNEILKRLEKKGFTADNLVLGIGSFSYEYVTRDTYGMAMKATNVILKEGDYLVPRPIFKDPKTNSGGFTKKSAKGYLKVIEGVLKDEISSKEYKKGDPEDMLKQVYIDGRITKKVTLEEIRKKITEQL